MSAPYQRTAPRSRTDYTVPFASTHETASGIFLYPPKFHKKKNRVHSKCELSFPSGLPITNPLWVNSANLFSKIFKNSNMNS
jgi:hypothetical protein